MSGRGSFNATRRLSSDISRASNTMPKPPRPSSRSITYLPSKHIPVGNGTSLSRCDDLSGWPACVASGSGGASRAAPSGDSGAKASVGETGGDGGGSGGDDDSASSGDGGGETVAGGCETLVRSFDSENSAATAHPTLNDETRDQIGAWRGSALVASDG